MIGFSNLWFGIFIPINICEKIGIVKGGTLFESKDQITGFYAHYANIQGSVSAAFFSSASRAAFSARACFNPSFRASYFSLS